MIINVLSSEYYQDCRIQGSVNIPLEQLQQRSAALDKNTEIVVYCAHANCPKSREAWHLLHNLGFTNVSAYEGGIREWCQKGYPTAGMCQQPYINQPLEPVQQEDRAVRTISAEDLRSKLQQN